ncbi:UNVERIFIED_CONTAM: cold-regulated plasma membrane protein 2 [Sesamum calycinum]|uniref:Cold-regulated plasma membrane protein 2 n=1 Tax=Sesamum calycinum TaxID=2727403 RepID=A0AAW2PMI6_9LAMI
MKTDNAAASELISSDLKDVGNAVKKLANHAVKLGGLGFGTSFLKWVAAVAAIYLLILDRTNWKTNILTSLLIPYIFLSLPSWLFSLLRGELGKWIALIAVVLRLFFPNISQEHIRASGGFRNSFTKSKGISNSIGILLLFLYPVWALVLSFL